MPQSPLSQVPGHSACPMAGTTGVGASAGPVFPCRVHFAQTDRIFGASERQNHLQHPVPRRRSNLAGNGRRSQTLRRIHWLPGGAPHLGSEPASASPSPLHRAWRRHLARRFALDCLPQRLLLSSGAPPQPPLPEEVLEATAPSLPPRRPALHRPTPIVGFCPRLRSYV